MKKNKVKTLDNNHNDKEEVRTLNTDHNDKGKAAK